MIVSIVPKTSGVNFMNIGSSLFVTNSGVDKVDSVNYGDAGPNRYVIDNIFTATGGAEDMTATTTINVTELIKTKNPNFTAANDFSKRQIIVAIIGEASDTAPAGTYHPIIAIDDIHVSYWIDWYKTVNLGLAENGGNPPTGIRDIAVSTTKIIGKKGEIEVTGAQAAVNVYNITGQKVGTLTNKGSQSIPVPAGIYLVAEKNQPTVKVIVK
jgi:hypothetical protein